MIKLTEQLQILCGPLTKTIKIHVLMGANITSGG